MDTEQSLYISTTLSCDIISTVMDFWPEYNPEIHNWNKASKTGDLKTIKKLHKHKIKGADERVMDWAANNNHLNVLEFLHNNGYKCTTNAMDWASRNGHFRIVYFLHINRTEGCTKNAMDDAVKFDNLEIVKFLYKYRNEGCTMNVIRYAENTNNAQLIEFILENQPWTRRTYNNVNRNQRDWDGDLSNLLQQFNIIPTLNLPFANAVGSRIMFNN